MSSSKSSDKSANATGVAVNEAASPSIESAQVPSTPLIDNNPVSDKSSTQKEDVGMTSDHDPSSPDKSDGDDIIDPSSDDDDSSSSSSSDDEKEKKKKKKKHQSKGKKPSAAAAKKKQLSSIKIAEGDASVTKKRRTVNRRHSRDSKACTFSNRALKDMALRAGVAHARWDAIKLALPVLHMIGENIIAECIMQASVLKSNRKSKSVMVTKRMAICAANKVMWKKHLIY